MAKINNRIDQTFDELLDSSMRHQVDVGDLAEALADLADGIRPEADDHRRARDVAAREWGAFLP